MSGPRWVPHVVVLTATRSFSATSTSMVTVRSGSADAKDARKRLTPSTPAGKPGGMLWLTKSGAKNSSTLAGSLDSRSSACMRRTSSLLRASWAVAPPSYPAGATRSAMGQSKQRTRRPVAHPEPSPATGAQS